MFGLSKTTGNNMGGNSGKKDLEKGSKIKKEQNKNEGSNNGSG
jgi:hypothetical protein